jgi:hypothetical protein
MQISGHKTREDAYFEILEAFLRTSARYFDVDTLTPPADHHITPLGIDSGD